MSVQKALLFINSLRRDDGFRSAIGDRVDEMNLDTLIDIALAQGFMFTEDDFRQAFRLDWAMRALHNKRRAPAEPPSVNARLDTL